MTKNLIVPLKAKLMMIGALVYLISPIDLIPDRKAPAQRGIFKIEKGELFLAMGLKDGKAPTDFTGDSALVMVLEREKDKK